MVEVRRVHQDTPSPPLKSATSESPGTPSAPPNSSHSLAASLIDPVSVRRIFKVLRASIAVGHTYTPPGDVGAFEGPNVLLTAMELGVVHDFFQDKGDVPGEHACRWVLWVQVHLISNFNSNSMNAATIQKLHLPPSSAPDSRMDRPSWNDTLTPHSLPASHVSHAASSRSGPNIYNGSDSDDEYTNNAVRGVRRARTDELEGLLADAYRRQRHLAPLAPRPPGRRAPSTPRHISLWGFNLFGNRRGRSVALEGGTTSCTRRLPLALSLMTHHRSARQRSGVGAAVGLRPGTSTDDLLARAMLESASTQLKDISATDVARRARSGSTASHLEGELEIEQDRRARRKARKKMRHLAAALAEPNTPEFEGFPCSGSGKLPPQPTFHAPSSGYNGIPSPFM
ncbi:hypothetical protein B0H13DRAFT_2538199 [Mycena leptocephala]|nr:hypothetical protein B0H13DRAFT_2538199 [Mycena leptocephala]